MRKIRVLLADDHAVLRAGLRLLIDTQPDMEVVGEAGDHEAAFLATVELRPDVLTLDLSMPRGASASVISTQVIESIVREVPQTRVLVLTMHDDDAYFRTAMAAGAIGYVVKQSADVELIEAIRTVAKGQVYTRVRPSVGSSSIDAPAEMATGNKSPLETLSAREREVLGLVAQGHTNQAIADRLSLSVKTIESYRARLMAKLGLQNRAELTQFAIETGVLQSGTTSQEHSDSG